MHRRLLVSVIASSLVCFGMLALALGFGWSPKLGLDLEGGLSAVFKPDKAVSTSTLQDVANIMTLRVNGLGVSSPNISTQGNDVVVDLPGVKDPQAILKLLGTTAQLFFRPVLCNAPAYVAPAKGTANAPTTKTPVPTCAAPYLYTASDYQGSSGSNYNYPPTDNNYAAYPTSTVDNPADAILINADGNVPSARYVLGPATVEYGGKLQTVTGTIIKSAYAQLDTQNNQWQVVFELTGQGTNLFNAVAKLYYGTLVADDLDGQVISAPIIEAMSFPGSGQVSGNFTHASANQLALELNYGALPVSLTPQTAQTVSASLGKSSLQAGLFAGLLGLLLVLLYTVFYYRALGIVVFLGLITTGALIYGLISVLGASSLDLTLDLSGVTGLIVSVGITVDSYVVYFERLKDEVRAGRSIRAAVDRGFKSAYRTILSADAVSLIGALVLWVLSVGDVRGFAFMLGISTLIDVITAFFFTRPFVILLGRNRVFTEARHLGVARGLATRSAT
ncbi:MAG TPA: protein translocase subunit SecD [Acidimicrobiales bacterium]